MCFSMYTEPPEAPEDLEIHSGTSRSIQLSWYPSFDGNSPVTQYIVQYKIASGNHRLDTRSPILPQNS